MNGVDFLTGTWDVANRRLTTQLTPGPATWAEFPATTAGHSLFGGAGNIDEITFPTLGHQGATLRLFDRETELWSLYWSDSRNGRLFPPVTGRFTGDRGDFHGNDTHEGRPVRVHFVWHRLGPDAARWEQEFSADGGASWQLNWTMDFTRTGRAAA
ncbi:hypothetical protein [Streptomyces sp. NBC_00209]|uniref:hypothetical protein n=1 Tax=Streptomyces sp. NBC_00209 TaxID=2975682 RepID=UPI00324E6581